jgi:poly [ADP-ribose] polymerase
MSNVSDYLISEYHTLSGLQKLQNIIDNEQQVLDVMETQVKMNKSAQILNDTKDSISQEGTILDLIGISLKEITDSEKEEIKKLMGKDSRRFVNAIKVLHPSTDSVFKKDSKFKNSLLFHGSRTENFLSICKTGLTVRPSNVVKSGSMFGDGIYFASQAQKSFTYTYSNGGKYVYLALFEVFLGNEYVINNQESWHSNLNYDKLRSLGDYDSTHALKGCRSTWGMNLLNEEFIVYKNNQCTIRYIIQCSAN